jgi:hypothetical protein
LKYFGLLGSFGLGTSQRRPVLARTGRLHTLRESIPQNGNSFHALTAVWRMPWRVLAGSSRWPRSRRRCLRGEPFGLREASGCLLILAAGALEGAAELGPARRVLSSLPPAAPSAAVDLDRRAR